MDRYFKEHGIDPDAEYSPGVTYRDEYERQLQLQQNGLNDLTVGEWQHNVKDYDANKRMGQDDQADARVDAGGKPGDGKAVLHGPDQYPGGRPDAFDGLGDSGINSSIGSQWRRERQGLLNRTNDAIDGIPEELSDLLRFVHMNVRLVPV